MKENEKKVQQVTNLTKESDSACIKMGFTVMPRCCFGGKEGRGGGHFLFKALS